MTALFSLIANLPSQIEDIQRIQRIIGSTLNDQYEEPYMPTILSDDGKCVERDIKNPIPIITCDTIHLSMSSMKSFESSTTRLVAIFCPATLVETALEQTQQQSGLQLEKKDTLENQVKWLEKPSKLSQTLLSLIHPVLSQNYAIRAILTYQNNNQQNSPGDIIILDLSHCPYQLIVEELMNATNGEVIRSGPDAILKVLLLCKLEIRNPITSSMDFTKLNEPTVEIPPCAVCLFRIEPSRLGLPRPRTHQLCSKFCSPMTLPSDNESKVLSCPRQRLLLPWPLPNLCTSCQIIRNYWRKINGAMYKQEDSLVFCSLCGMQETLWVCLTCAFVGCGRYSNKHAAEHNDATHHPFCLELSTLRIWSYVDSEYVHRADLLECPESLQNLHQISRADDRRHLTNQLRNMPPVSFVNNNTSEQIARDGVVRLLESDNLQRKNLMSSTHSSYVDLSSRSPMNHYESMVVSSFPIVDEKTPKKATMIGEEYEVLLHSALEDQAQFYEGEITSLRATLASQQVDQTNISPEEALEIENLRFQISKLRVEIDRAGRDLLDAQALEAGYRATSQRLLREQAITQEMLKKTRDESRLERVDGEIQIEDLELQIADLKANQRMMEQFSQNEDLKNSQIFGAEQQICQSSKSNKNRKGKKISKLFRK